MSVVDPLRYHGQDVHYPEVYGSETLRQFTRIIHSRHAVVLGVTLEVDGSGVEVGRWSKVVVIRYCSESQSVYAQCIRGVHHTRVYNAVLVGVLLTYKQGLGFLRRGECHECDIKTHIRTLELY